MSTNQQVDPGILDAEMGTPPRAAAANGAPQEAQTPWDDLSDEDREWIQNKRIDSPAALARAYRELEQARGRESNELGDLRRFQREMLEAQQAREQQAQQQGQQQAQQSGIDWRGIAEQCVDAQTGEVDLGSFASIIFQLSAQTSYQAAEQRMQMLLNEAMEQRVAPLIERYEIETVAEDVAEAQEFYGERFEDVSRVADEIIDADPGVLDRIGTADVFAKAWRQILSEEEGQRRREADGATLIRSGRRTERRTTPAERELDLLDLGQRNLRSRDGL